MDAGSSRRAKLRLSRLMTVGKRRAPRRAGMGVVWLALLAPEGRAVPGGADLLAQRHTTGWGDHVLPYVEGRPSYGGILVPGLLTARTLTSFILQYCNQSAGYYGSLRGMNVDYSCRLPF